MSRLVAKRLSDSRIPDTFLSMHGLYYNRNPEIFGDIPVDEAMEFMRKFMMFNYQFTNNGRITLFCVGLKNRRRPFICNSLTRDNYELLIERLRGVGIERL